MPFQKKSVAIGAVSQSDQVPALQNSVTRAEAGADANHLAPACRPSPLDGRPTISTGTGSLDSIIAGKHAGLPLGTSLLVEELGTVSLGGLLLRHFAAEGLVQGHHVHALGYGDSWKADLPALARDTVPGTARPAPVSSHELKIAWRYERLAQELSNSSNTTATPTMQRFCRKFDLTGQLRDKDIHGHFHGYPSGTLVNPFDDFISHLTSHLQSSPSQSLHRVIIPNLLCPTMYTTSDCRPEAVLRFLTRIRSILRQYPGRVAAVITFSTTLYPRTSGLTRWVELLSDAVLELTSQQWRHTTALEGGLDGNDSSRSSQGFLNVRKLAIYHDSDTSSKQAKAAFDRFSFHVRATGGIDVIPHSLPPAISTAGPRSNGVPNRGKNNLDF